MASINWTPLEMQSRESIERCPICQQMIEIAWNFCPNCGRTLREQPLSTSIGKQIGIYSLSFFLPPFGLAPAFKYLKQKNSSAKLIGVIAIILTVVSLISIILTFKSFMDSYSKILNSLTRPY